MVLIINNYFRSCIIVLMENRKRISPIVVLVIIYCYLASAGASMTLGTNAYIEFMAAALCWYYFYTNKMLKTNSASIIASILLVASAAYMGHGMGALYCILPALRMSMAVVVLNVKNEVRVCLLQKLSSWYAVLLVIAIIVWLLHFIIPLPHTTTVGDVWWDASGMRVDNYFFFKESDYFETGADTMRRFQGMFKEPGHLGTITALLLICNRFEFQKKENLVFLVTVLLSVSAAAYVLLVLGYLSLRLSERGGKHFIPALLLVIVVILFFMFYNGGDNLVGNMIFSKVTRDEGAIEGRVSLTIYALFESMWATGNDLLFGKSQSLLIEMEDQDVGAGGIVYFVLHGIVGTGILILAYYWVYKSCKSIYGLFVFFIYIITFLQRSYLDWDAFYLPYILGLPYFQEVASLRRQANSISNGH